MTPHDDHSQQRQPLFFPVVIATVLLTIIGMVGGYLLAEQRGTESAPDPDPTSAPPLIAQAGPPCLDQTQRMGEWIGANGELREVLRVRTKKRTEAWICEDRSGQLYYHANSGGADAAWVEGKTALFLHNVYPDGAGGFEVRASDGNVFAVNKERLLVRYTTGRTDEQKVVPE